MYDLVLAAFSVKVNQERARFDSGHVKGWAEDARLSVKDLITHTVTWKSQPAEQRA